MMNYITFILGSGMQNANLCLVPTYLFYVYTNIIKRLTVIIAEICMSLLFCLMSMPTIWARFQLLQQLVRVPGPNSHQTRLL